VLEAGTGDGGSVAAHTSGERSENKARTRGSSIRDEKRVLREASALEMICNA
jgi:hypothetical protein